MRDQGSERATAASIDAMNNRLAAPPIGAARRAWRRLIRNPIAMCALVVVVGIVLFALAAGLISTYVTGFSYRETNLETALSRPGENGHLLGSDGNGRDILTRLAYGARISLSVALLATFSTMLIGGSIGGFAGFAGGWIDGVLMRFADVLLSIPGLSLLFLISTLYRPGPWELALLIALVGWPGVARLVRGEVMAMREREFVDAARIAGATDRRIVLRHMLPNVLPTLIVWSSLVIPAVIMTEAGLSFLGLGVQPPRPSWGNMLIEAQSVYGTNWTNVFLPGFAIFLTALSVNLLGNGLRDAFDPRLER